MKQTAVEWLELNLLGLISFNSEELRAKYKDRVAKAKEMEKQQIIEARQDGYESTYNSCESGCMGREILEGSNEQYYNETFNK